MIRTTTVALALALTTLAVVACSSETEGVGLADEPPARPDIEVDDPPSTEEVPPATSSTSSVTTGAGGSGGESSDVGGAGGAGGGPGSSNDCCEASATPGCNDPAVQDCVCNLDPFCCANAWDATCVAEADSCNAGCGGGGGGGSNGSGGGGGDGDCGPCIAACLLQVLTDPCCDVLACVLATCDSSCFGVRLPLPDPACGQDPDPGPSNDCCSESSAPGCYDSVTEACVCAQDGYCCATAWDATCVAEVDSLGCGACF